MENRRIRCQNFQKFKNNNNNKLDDSELRSYWNKTKEYMTTQLRNIRNNVPILDVAKNESKNSKAKTI